jgi:hypothetical protein
LWNRIAEWQVFELRVYHPGTYMFMDHAMGHAYRGAMGIFRAAQ